MQGTTIREVAARAGVSVGTASSALRGTGRVAEATRQRVRSAAREMAYAPAAAATALASRRRTARRRNAFNLATMKPPRSASGREDPALAGIREGARELGYGLEEIELVSGLDLRQISRQCEARGVRGIVVCSYDRIDGLGMEDFDWSRFKAVKVRRVFPEIPIPVVRTSVSEMVKMALDQAFAQGYRSVHACFMRTTSEADDDTRVGTLMSYREGHLPEGARLTWRFRERGSELSTDDLAGDLDACQADAVFGFPWSTVFEAAQRPGRIPGRIGFIGFAINAGSTADGLAVSGVTACPAAQGRHAVHFLHRMILTGDSGVGYRNEQYVLAPEWVEGETLPCRHPGR